LDRVSRAKPGKKVSRKAGRKTSKEAGKKMADNTVDLFRN
jgi:hypothetical protein